MKKTLMIMLALVLVIAMSVTGTLAYLTSTTDVVTNTFTVGKVVIKLDEAKVNEYGVVDATATNRVTENTYKLIPGHSYTKDPTVHVEAGSEASYLFVKVTNGIKDIEDDTTIADQMKTNWVLVDEANGIYRYKNTVTPGDYKVFESFKLKSGAAVAGYADAKITIVACAVQADGLTETTALAQAKWTK